MKLTLLVENNPKIESFYMLNLSTWLGLEILPKKRTEFGIKYLETHASTISLIIVRARIDKENSAQEMINYVKNKNLSIPVIVIGPGKEVPGSFAHMSNSLQLKALIQACARALGITAKDMTNKVVPDFFPIPIVYFKVLRRSICPVFSKDIDNPNKYNLRIEKLKDFNEIVINQMIEEGVDFLYVDKMDRLEFVNNVTSELMTTLSAEEISEDEAMSAADKGVELLSKKLLTIGVTEETIQLAHKSLNTMKENTKKFPQLAKLLQRLTSNQASYLFKHTQILTYVALHIVRNVDWGTQEQEEKIAFISFFHDICLENDAQAKIKSTSELRAAGFTPQQKQLVERHAQMAAEMAGKFPHAPMGADQIIRQHHGSLNGIGFSEHWGNNVSPMSVVFIVAEEFTRIIMNNQDGQFNHKEMIREVKDAFPTARFQKTISLLESITF